MKQLTGIVFDVDGTLADTEETHRQAFNLAFEEFGLDWHWSPTLYAELLRISGGFERMCHFGADLRETFATEADFHKHIRELHRLKTRLYADMLIAGEVPLRAGVRRLLDEARHAGVRMAIATSTAMSNVKTLLDANLPPDWPSWFEVIMTCDQVRAKKPSPAVYEAVLSVTGLEPHRCIALEDTFNGLRAALGAGLPVLITTHYYTRHEHFSGAALVVDGLGTPEKPCRALGRPDWEAPCITLDILDELTREAAGRADADASNVVPLIAG